MMHTYAIGVAIQNPIQNPNHINSMPYTLKLGLKNLEYLFVLPSYDFICQFELNDALPLWYRPSGLLI